MDHEDSEFWFSAVRTFDVWRAHKFLHLGSSLVARRIVHLSTLQYFRHLLQLIRMNSETPDAFNFNLIHPSPTTVEAGIQWSAAPRFPWAVRRLSCHRFSWQLACEHSRRAFGANAQGMHLPVYAPAQHLSRREAGLGHWHHAEGFEARDQSPRDLGFSQETSVRNLVF